MPAAFEPSKPLEIALTAQEPASPSLVRLYYRHVNQAERYQVIEMRLQNGAHRATISASYTDSRFPLQYYFELKQGADKAWLYPGLNVDLTNEPYFVVRPHRTGAAS